MNRAYPYVKLKELCDVNQGLQIPIDERFTENAPNRYFYITVQFLKASHTNKFYVENPPTSSICKEDDILIVRTGSTGQIVTGVSGCFHNNFFKVNFNKELLDGRYLYHCLNTKEKFKEMLRRAGVTTIPDLNHFMFLDMEIPLPEKTIQIQIAKTLDFLDSKIELNNRINTELEAMAKTLYDYWFVQFDFPYDFAQGRPDANGKPYKTSGGKMIWNEALKREVPEGWEVQKLKEFATTGSGGTPLSTKQEYYKNGDIPWINSGELNSIYIVQTDNYITKEGLNNSSAKIFPSDTLLIALYGATAGKVSLLKMDAATNQAVCAILLKNQSLLYYLKFALSDLYQYLINLSSGSARDNLSQDLVKELIFAKPADNLIKYFNEIVNPSIEKIVSNIQENQKLTELRDWLLPMLMNGQVKVVDEKETELLMAAEPKMEYGK